MSYSHRGDFQVYRHLSARDGRLFCNLGTDVKKSKKPSFGWISPEQQWDPEPVGAVPNNDASGHVEGNIWLGFVNLTGGMRGGSSNNPRFTGWDLTSGVTNSKNTTDRANASWNYKATASRDYNLSHRFEAEMLVLHDNQDFWIRFLFKGRVDRGFIGLFGGDYREPVWCQRTFHPPENPVDDEFSSISGSSLPSSMRREDISEGSTTGSVETAPSVLEGSSR